jgi:hypothetical protein
MLRIISRFYSTPLASPTSGSGLQPRLVGTNISTSPLLAHLDLDLVLALDVVLDLFEAGISERTIVRG